MNRAVKLTLTALLALSPSAAISAPRSGTPPTGQVAVLVEMFTSEGCSDCPPADAVLSNLKKVQPVPGVQIIALGEHVDYWNNSHWSDKFSSAALTARQNDYAASFHNSQIYTPQLVVDGKTEFVGSDRNAALSAIARAARAPKADLEITKSGPTITVSVQNLPRGTGEAQVWLAVTEDGLQSQVHGGENSGRHLMHNAVVRQLHLLGNARSHKTFTASVPTGGGRSAVAFVQESESRHILGAALLHL